MKTVISKLKNIRKNVVLPQMINFTKDAMKDSTPVIRPLWMLNPDHKETQTIDNEFLIGDKVRLLSKCQTNFKSIKYKEDFRWKLKSK